MQGTRAWRLGEQARSVRGFVRGIGRRSGS
jgi:hypothetical protein